MLLCAVEIGLRELRQQASELVRRVQAGESITVTVSGRPAARLVPVAPEPWRPSRDLVALFAGPADPDWHRDRDLVDGTARDPWPS